MNIYADYSNRLNPDCYTKGRDGKSVLVLVCHNTAGPHDFNPGNQALSDAAALYLTSNDRQVSIHWVVGAEAVGAPIYRVVPEDSIAYHAGGTPPQFPSRWVNPDDGLVYGRYGLNQVSIGIELFGNEKDQVGPNQQAALKALVLDIVSRFPVIARPGHIVAHAELEGDRTDGKNWVNLAKGWVSGGATSASASAGLQTTPVSYQAKIRVGKATVRSGPGRSFSIITTLDATDGKTYTVDGEAHGDAIPDSRQASGSDDVWAHLSAVNGFVTRTALTAV